MSERLPEKRPAFEPAAGLVRPVPYDPQMPRPASTVAGGVLVVLRAIAGVVWLLTVAFGWTGWLRSIAAAFGSDASGGLDLDPIDYATGLAVLLVGGGIVLGAEALLGILILRGRNLPRVIVMVFSTVSIAASFVGWWAMGQEIRIGTTLVTLSLDILILLALSSRSAAAYARRRERRPRDPGRNRARDDLR